MDVVERAKHIREQIWEIVRIIKLGPRDLAALVIACLLFLAAKELPKMPYASKIRWSLGALGVSLVAWTFFRAWKLAVPTPLKVSEARPAAIKGPMAFTPEDGALFRRLGREKELAELLGHILDDQIPMIVVMGESGVGKTSLLRAGLSNVAAQKDIRYVYWESIPTAAEERLIHAITATWRTDMDGPLPVALADISPSSKSPQQSGSFRVIVLDQFEQLDKDSPEHKAVFDFLRRIATDRMPPYHTKWIVAFRRQYDPAWRDFELDLPGFHPPMLSLRLFAKKQAGEILATLAQAIEITLDQTLVDDVIESAANTNGQVPSVEVGIAMLVLSNLAIRERKTHLSLSDYQFAGGAQGLLAAYIGDRLEQYDLGEREAMLKAMLALADLQTNQRIPEGKTANELAQAADFPLARMRSFLEYLVSPRVRLLEAAPDSGQDEQRYRLPQERLIQALRQLTGRYLADVDQARLNFESAFRVWQNSKDPRGLLSGTQLNTILRYRGQLQWTEQTDAKEEFLARSRQRRKRRRFAAIGAILLLAAVSYIGVGQYERAKQIYDLRQAGLPGDLYSRQGQIQHLEIYAPVSNLNWLKSNRLKFLLVHSKSLHAVETIPASLADVDFSDCSNLSDLTGIENLSALTHLNASRTNLMSLAGIDKLTTLTGLNLSGAKNLKGLDGIENLIALTHLDVSDTGVASLAEIAKLGKLIELNLSRTFSLKSLAGIENLTTLKQLDLSITTNLKEFTGIENLRALAELNLSGNTNMADLAGIKTLTTLTKLNLSVAGLNTDLTSLAGIEKLAMLTELNLSGNSNLTSLAGIEKLPALTRLDLGYTDLRDLTAIEKLNTPPRLNLSGNTCLKSLAGIEKLHALAELNLSRTELVNLAGIGRLSALTELDLSFSKYANHHLTEIENLTTLRSLNLSGTKVTSPLVEIENLIGLTGLNANRTKLTSLAGIEKLTALRELDVSHTNLNNPFTGIERLTKLTKLNVSYTDLTSLIGIEKLTGLTELDVSNTELKSLAGIEKLAVLTKLNLSSNSKLTSLVGIEKLPELEEIDLSHTAIADLRPLSQLAKLKAVDLRGTGIKSLQYVPFSVTTLMLGD